MPQIDGYSFGNITIDGDEYENDVIILPDDVKDHWWRAKGHELQPKDLETVVDADIERLIVGQGFHGRMNVPQKTIAFLNEQGIAVETYKTTEAWKQYNETRDDNTAAAFHLTC